MSRHAVVSAPGTCRCARSLARRWRCAPSSTGSANLFWPRSAITSCRPTATAQRFCAVLGGVRSPTGDSARHALGTPPGVGLARRRAPRHRSGRAMVLLPHRTAPPHRRQLADVLAAVRRVRPRDRASRTSRPFAVLWGLLRGAAMAGSARDPRPLLDRAIELTEQHRAIGSHIAATRGSRRAGTPDAGILGGGPPAPGDGARRADATSSQDSTGSPAFDEALVVVYRILFLLFAEARGLVPRWHPIYRDSYTIEALRGPVEMLPRPVGVWEALQAIARLAHRGCRIGALRVPPFNGRLFSPAHAPLADSRAARRSRRAEGAAGVDDAAGARRIRAHRLRRSRRRAARRRVRTSPRLRSGAALAGTARRRSSAAERRKSTGAFYTPRPLTEYLVRRALAPLVARRVARGDSRAAHPRSGHGQRRLPCGRVPVPGARRMRRRSYAKADCRPTTSPTRERAEFRRAIAQRCLYGVDINPMAVQLGRLSLWLATLSADRPSDVSGPSTANGKQPRRGVTRRTSPGSRPAATRRATAGRAAALWR